MKYKLHLYLIASSALAPALAIAQDANPIDGPAIVLGAFKVNGESRTASSVDLISSVTFMGSDQIENESVDYPLELFNKLPGVYLTDFNQGVITADVSMRGFNGEGSSPHTRLVADGLPLNLNSGYNDMGAIFPLEIESVGVVKGIADPRFGLNAVAGSLSVNTHQVFDGQKLKIMAGGFDTYELQGLAGYRHGGFSQTYFLGYRDSGGYRDHSSIEKHSLAGKWFYTGSESDWKIGLSARIHDFESDAPGYLSRAQAAATPKASPLFSDTDGGTMNNEQFSLHAEGELADGLSLSTKAYHHETQRHRFVRFTERVSQQERVEDEQHHGVVTNLRWRLEDGVVPTVFDAGLEYHEQDALNQRFVSNERVRGATTRDHRYGLENLGGFVSADLTFDERWDVIAALRFDRFDGEFTNRANGAETPIIDYGTIWQPKLSSSYRFNEKVQAYASYGRSFQIGAGSGAYGTQPIDASKNDGYELGLRLLPTSDLNARLVFWRQTASDEVKPKSDGSGDFENVGETKREGIDLELNWHATDKLSLWAAYTLQNGVFVNPGNRPAELAIRGNKIDHVPDYMVKTGIDAKLTPSLDLSLSLLGQGDYHLNAANATERFGDYLLANIDLRYRWQNLTLGLHLKNAFDEYHDYVWFDGAETLHSPGDGRSLLTSINYEF